MCKKTGRLIICEICGKKKWRKPSAINKLNFCSVRCMGKWHIGRQIPEETKKKISESLKGEKNYLFKKHLSEETKKKMSKAHKGKYPTLEARLKKSVSFKGKNHWNWQGGISPINERIRKGIEYRLWREAVYARDNWTCQKCGRSVSGELNAHHIKSFAKYPELRTSIENGITLCRKCHSLTDNYGLKRKNQRG